MRGSGHENGGREEKRTRIENIAQKRKMKIEEKTGEERIYEKNI